MAIPVVLLYYARHRKNLPFKHLFWLFGLFIAACGATHLMSYITTFCPVYRFEGLIKLVTAAASWGTVFALWRISPRALSMRMPEELEQEIATRQKAEEELLLLNHTLATRTQELEAANRELEGFCYSVSHDLRSPLRGIVGNSRMVLEDAGEQLDDSSRQNLERLGAAALRMSDLVDDLLNFSRLSKVEPQQEEIDLSLMASAIAEELKGDYPSVTFEVQPDLRVHGDPHLLRMVLYNLMENACKYSSREREPHVWVGEENGEGFVRDNGIGFDMQFLPKLFQPFERLHRDEGIPGTGIGLANVKRIVERHGGKVRAEGRVGEGATFYFRLA